MSDPVRTPHASDRSLSDADREARIEELLLSGLDHYFGGRYEQAINIWTRVAFLERRHGRARAYIERARSALAERQRESEELLHGGVAAYNAGDFVTARDLLTRAVEQGDPSDTALVFLQRLTRLEAATDAVRSSEASPTAATVQDHAPAHGRHTNWLMTIAVSGAIAVAILLAARPIASWLAELPISAPAVEAPRPDPLPVVFSSEVLIARAREMYADRRLRDALRMLERVQPADPLRPEADRLRADVQRDLLASVTNPRRGRGVTPR